MPPTFHVTGKWAVRYDKQRYRGRHLIENAFCRLEDLPACRHPLRQARRPLFIRCHARYRRRPLTVNEFGPYSVNSDIWHPMLARLNVNKWWEAVVGICLLNDRFWPKAEWRLRRVTGPLQTTAPYGRRLRWLRIMGFDAADTPSPAADRQE